jgi:hypothetical protein
MPMNHVAKLLIRQAHKLIGLALERWDDATIEELDVDGVVDDDIAKQERLKSELRRRGVNV